MAKILLVEDDKSLREIYGVRLQAEGYEITSAGDGEEALALAIKARPDLIVSDVMMPKISGFDMLDILRSTTETKDIKVIMMTALSSEDQRARGEQLGANKYLVKSQVGIEDVVRAVHEVLGDAPVAPAGNAFATPGPSAMPRPAPAAAVPAREATTPTPASVPSTPAPAPVAEPALQPAPAAPTVAAPTQTPAAPQPIPSPVAPPAATPSEPRAAAMPTPQPAAPQAPQPAPTTPASPAPFSLPQPTAPFSTDRPAGLADRIIQPLERPTDTSEPIADQMDKELGGDPSASPFANSTPATPDMSTADPTPEPHGIEFEETPRAAGSETPQPPAPPAPAA